MLLSTGGMYYLLSNVMGSRTMSLMLSCRFFIQYASKSHLIILQLFIMKKLFILNCSSFQALTLSIYSTFVQLSSNEVSFRRERLYVNKLNIILVQVNRDLMHVSFVCFNSFKFGLRSLLKSLLFWILQLDNLKHYLISCLLRGYVVLFHASLVFILVPNMAVKI